MTDAVSIANRALSDAGTRSSISSFGEGSNESNAVGLIYMPVRQQLLRAAHWGFAGATAGLSLLKSAPGTAETPGYPVSGVWSAAYPPPGWSYEYAYPADCLAARKLIGNYGGAAGSVPIFPAGVGGVGLSGFAGGGFAGGGFAGGGQRFSVATDLDGNGNQISVVLANVDQALLSYTRDITVEALWDSLFAEAMVAALAGKLCFALSGDKGRANDLMKIANERIMEARVADGNEGLTVLDHTPDWITRGHGMVWPGGGEFVLPYGPLFGGF
jgi:hypothetical protein